MNASLLAYILIRKLVDHIHVHTNIPVYVGTYSKTLVIGLIPTYRNLFLYKHLTGTNRERWARFHRRVSTFQFPESEKEDLNMKTRQSNFLLKKNIIYQFYYEGN